MVAAQARRLLMEERQSRRPQRRLRTSSLRSRSHSRPRRTRAARARAGELDDSELVPKRSVRLAAKSRYREPKPEAQGRKVMIKKLGVEVETQLPDEASVDEFQTAFALPLSASTREAMNVLLFPGKKWCRQCYVTQTV
jgi:hypothetical protein